MRNFYQNSLIEKFAAIQTKRVTVRQLIAFSRNMNQLKLLRSANYVRQELSVRLAHRIRDFQSLPFIVGINPRIELVYQLYMDAFEQLQKLPEITTAESNQAFCDLLKHMLNQHRVVIPQLAAGMAECSEHLAPARVDLFMNNMLRTRIGRRVLAEQHICLTEQFKNSKFPRPTTFLGVIDTSCDAGGIVKKCKLLARDFLLANGIHALKIPEVIVDGHNGVRFVYIPDHIEYIIFELLKNAMQFQSASDQQPIKVTISSSATVGAASSGGDDLLTSNITFRISDQGGGFSRELLLPDNPHSIWSFSHCQKHFMRNSTDNKDDKRHPTDMPQVAGKLSDPSSSSTNLHIGLQLARVFANYWGGDLKICTMYGYGSDAMTRARKLHEFQMSLYRSARPSFFGKMQQGVEEKSVGQLVRLSNRTVAGGSSSLSNDSPVNSYLGSLVTSSTAATVLPENMYVDALERIIQRDFFPDLPKLRTQVEYMEAMERGDLEGMRSIAVGYRQQQAISSARDDADAAPGIIPRIPTAQLPGSILQQRDRMYDLSHESEIFGKSLDDFQRQFDSEDNASFAKLIRQENDRKRDRYKWLHNPTDGSLRLTANDTSEPASTAAAAITQGEDKTQQSIEGRRINSVSSWNFQPKNSLMYIPDGVKPTIAISGHHSIISHDQTRLNSVQHLETGKVDAASKLAGPSPYHWRFLDQGPGEALKRLATSKQSKHASEPIIRYDTYAVTPSANSLTGPQTAPNIDGFSLVPATPSPMPHVGGATPLMTWGHIEGTPMLLDHFDIGPLDGSNIPVSNNGQPVFKIPEPPLREQLSRKLADDASRRIKQRQKEQIRQSSRPSPLLRPPNQQKHNTTAQGRLSMLSPAARQLYDRTRSPAITYSSSSSASRQSASSPMVKIVRNDELSRKTFK